MQNFGVRKMLTVRDMREKRDQKRQEGKKILLTKYKIFNDYLIIRPSLYIA